MSATAMQGKMLDWLEVWGRGGARSYSGSGKLGKRERSTQTRRNFSTRAKPTSRSIRPCASTSMIFSHGGSTSQTAVAYATAAFFLCPSHCRCGKTRVCQLGFVQKAVSPLCHAGDAHFPTIISCDYTSECLDGRLDGGQVSLRVDLRHQFHAQGRQYAPDVLPG